MDGYMDITCEFYIIILEKIFSQILFLNIQFQV